MKIHSGIITLLFLLTCITNAGAQSIKNLSSQYTADKASKELKEEWWGYFDGDYDNISVIGLGGSVETPVEYSCAIRIKAGNPELLGKRIKAFKFAFERLNYIENVNVWLSKKLPQTPQDADIFNIPVEKETLKSFEKDNDVNVLNFAEPYQILNEDFYVGYSFTVTSNDGDLCTYPIVVSYANTMENAFLMNWGSGWVDNAGRNYGNLALMLLLDDGGEFTVGDANYDMKINVVDVSYIIDYILNGEGNIFNINGADIDANGQINVVDVESLINIILEKEPAPAENFADGKDIIMTHASDGKTSVMLNAENQYRGFQMDVVLPEGTDITSIQPGADITTTHMLKYARVSDNRYRVIASSINGECIDAETLLNINASTDDIRIENIVFATSGLKEKHFDNISGNDVTSVDNIICSEHDGDTYNVYGMKVNPEKLDRGIYIVNGKKIIKK